VTTSRHAESRTSGACTFAIVGLGYVGLPTALALIEVGHRVIGIDLSAQRLEDIAKGRVDLTPPDLMRLRNANAADRFITTTCPGRIADADVVLICVPTPVDTYQVPDHSFVSDACRDVVQAAHVGQVIVLTSTTSVGTTRTLLVEPLERAGLRVGTDVFVAFSPERIDPGNTSNPQSTMPRVVGGVTEACSMLTSQALSGIANGVHNVSSPEAAELTKLLENSFRATNIALANEFADIACTLSLDITEVIEAAASKPHGFMAFYPGPGVGGHCIPCDPHYLLWQLRRHKVAAPLLTQAMHAIAQRPARIVQRVTEELAKSGRPTRDAHLLVVGVAYKPGVEDVRETPAVQIMEQLQSLGLRVSYFDPFVRSLKLSDGREVESKLSCEGGAYDVVLIHTFHPGLDLEAINQCGIVIDASYQTGPKRGIAVLA
jgi:nucleotide sugar dehydrogenase